MRKWTELFGSLGEAVLQLLASEVADLARDLGGSARGLLHAIGLLALTAFVLFWAVGVLATVLILVLSLWWPPWLATLVVGAALLLVAAATGGAGWSKLQQLERPDQTIRRHLDDHLGWWQEQMAEEGQPGGEGEQQ